MEIFLLVKSRGGDSPGCCWVLRWVMELGYSAPGTEGPAEVTAKVMGMFMISSVLSHAVETGDNLNIMGDGSKRMFCVVCIAGVCWIWVRWVWWGSCDTALGPPYHTLDIDTYHNGDTITIHTQNSVSRSLGTEQDLLVPRKSQTTKVISSFSFFNQFFTQYFPVDCFLITHKIFQQCCM